MSKRDRALEYNAEMRETLQLLWDAMPKGQQKQALKSRVSKRRCSAIKSSWREKNE